MLPSLQSDLGREMVNKMYLASAVCRVVKERLLRNDAVGSKMMSRKLHQ